MRKRTFTRMYKIELHRLYLKLGIGVFRVKRDFIKGISKKMFLNIMVCTKILEKDGMVLIYLKLRTKLAIIPAENLLTHCNYWINDHLRIFCICEQNPLTKEPNIYIVSTAVFFG